MADNLTPLKKSTFWNFNRVEQFEYTENRPFRFRIIFVFILFSGLQCSKFIVVSDNLCAQDVNVFGDGQSFRPGEVLIEVRPREGGRWCDTRWMTAIRDGGKGNVLSSRLLTFIGVPAGTGSEEVRRRIDIGRRNELRARHGRNQASRRPGRVREKHEVSVRGRPFYVTTPLRTRLHETRISYFLILVSHYEMTTSVVTPKSRF